MGKMRGLVLAVSCCALSSCGYVTTPLLPVKPNLRAEKTIQRANEVTTNYCTNQTVAFTNSNNATLVNCDDGNKWRLWGGTSFQPVFSSWQDASTAWVKGYSFNSLLHMDYYSSGDTLIKSYRWQVNYLFNFNYNDYVTLWTQFSTSRKYITFNFGSEYIKVDNYIDSLIVIINPDKNIGFSSYVTNNVADGNIWYPAEVYVSDTSQNAIVNNQVVGNTFVNGDIKKDVGDTNYHALINGMATNAPNILFSASLQSGSNIQSAYYSVISGADYEQGYKVGYSNGQTNPTALSFIKGAFSAVQSFLNIPIMGASFTIADLVGALVALLILGWLLSWFR